MKLKNGLYVMVFVPDENDDSNAKYLGAIRVGEIPSESRNLFLNALIEGFKEKYCGMQRPFCMDFCYHDDEGDSIYPENLTEGMLRTLALKRRAISPEYQEVLDFAESVANDLKQVIVGADAPPLTELKAIVTDGVAEGIKATRKQPASPDKKKKKPPPEPANTRRDARIYELRKEGKSFKEICDIINKASPKEVLDEKVAGQALSRYCKRYKLEYPYGKRGRKS